MKKKKSECYEKVYEPMYDLEVRLYHWEEGKREYEHLIDRFIQDREIGNTKVEPVIEDKSAYRVFRLENKCDYRTLIHELYHLVNAVRGIYDLCEESWAYLIWWLADEFIE